METAPIKGMLSVGMSPVQSGDMRMRFRKVDLGKEGVSHTTKIKAFIKTASKVGTILKNTSKTVRSLQMTRCYVAEITGTSGGLLKATNLLIVPFDVYQTVKDGCEFCQAHSTKILEGIKTIKALETVSAEAKEHIKDDSDGNKGIEKIRALYASSEAARARASETSKQSVEHKGAHKISPQSKKAVERKQKAIDKIVTEVLRKMRKESKRADASVTSVVKYIDDTTDTIVGKVKKQMMQDSLDASLSFTESLGSMCLNIEFVSATLLSFGALAINCGLDIGGGVMSLLSKGGESAAVDSLVQLVRDNVVQVSSTASTALLPLTVVGSGLSLAGLALQTRGVYRSHTLLHEIDRKLHAHQKDGAFSVEYPEERIIDVLEHIRQLSEDHPRKLSNCGVPKKFSKAAVKLLDEIEKDEMAPIERGVKLFEARVLIENMRVHLGKERSFKIVSLAVTVVGLSVLGISLGALVVPGAPAALPIVLGVVATLTAFASIGLIAYKLTRLRAPIDPTRLTYIPREEHAFTQGSLESMSRRDRERAYYLQFLTKIGVQYEQRIAEKNTDSSATRLTTNMAPIHGLSRKQRVINALGRLFIPRDLASAENVIRHMHYTA